MNILINRDYEYYMNKPLEVMEQNAFMNQLPYIERINTFYGIIDNIETNKVIFKTTSNYFDFKEFKENDIIRLNVFFNNNILEVKDYIFCFPQLEKEYKFLYNYSIFNNNFIVVELVKNENNELVFKIIDNEKEPIDMKYQNYCSINECIRQAIKIFETYLDYHIIQRKEYIKLENESIKDKEKFLKDKAKLLFKNEAVISDYRFEYKNNTNKEIIGMYFNIGFSKYNFPQDLKRAIQDHTNFLWQEKGDLVYFGYKENGYKSFEASDITKNILERYRKKLF